LVPHPGGPKIAPLLDGLREAPSRLATYVKHLARSIPKQVVVLHEVLLPEGARGSSRWRGSRQLYR
jgi:hypothetical protein